MAETAAAPPPLSSESTKKRKKQQKQQGKRNIPKQKQPAEPAADDSMTWSEQLAADDPFSILAGGNEGGFLSLEEFDEAEYGFIGGLPEFDGSVEETPSSLRSKEEYRNKEKTKTKKKKKKKTTKKKKKSEETRGEIETPIEVNAQVVALADASGSNGVVDDIAEELHLDDDEFYAWKELRLHPLLMKSIRKLGFKEPSPIQKACIPAAAHQGKDVIGAAETGSGKTLAFGLPILQRLLEGQEKSTKVLEKEAGFVKESPLRALIVAPTRELALQVSDHIKEAAIFTNIKVVPIVGGMSTEKQERLLKRRPEIVVGTPGRLWELMSRGEHHIVELQSLSFFVLDEADRMIESGHFPELQSIIDMLPRVNGFTEQNSESTQICRTVPNLQLKKRQTFVFSATIALSDNFRKKLKRGSSSSKSASADSLSSIEKLSERAGMRPDAAIVDLTSALIVADKLEESFIECREDDKEAYLYYILRVHGQGRTIVFCTSIAALRRISSLLRILGIKAWTLHAQMQQRARLKAVDRFRDNDNAVLVATDVAARGLDIPAIRTVIHYQLPHSTEVYIHRSGRTARASADGCCIALISPGDKTKFFALCNSMSKESLRTFPLEVAYMPEVMKRLSLARQIDKILHKSSQESIKKSWFERNAESVELAIEDSGSEEDVVKGHKLMKATSLQLKKLQKELSDLLTGPLQPKAFSRRFLAGAGVSPLLQRQLEELSKRKPNHKINSKENKKAKLVIIGQDCVEPLQALRSSGQEVSVSSDKRKELRTVSETLKRKRREDKKRAHEQRRKEKKRRKEGMK